MGLWSGTKEFFGSLFSDESIVNKAVDGVYNGLDMSFFTPEEQAMMRKTSVELKVKALEATQPYKKAQRFIAIVSMYNFFAAFWVGVFVYLVAEEKFEGYLAIVKTFELGWIMLAIIAWYFKFESFSLFGGKNNEKK